MVSLRNVYRPLLASLVCTATAAHAVDLIGLRTSQADLQRRLQARADCLAWYEFGARPEGLTFHPAPEKDTLRETDGAFPGQRATCIFHGKMTGPLVDIPETGFTLSCSPTRTL